jgi:hypothetical protein
LGFYIADLDYFHIPLLYIHIIGARISLIPLLDPEGICHPFPIRVAGVFRSIPTPLMEFSDAGVAFSHNCSFRSSRHIFSRRSFYHRQIGVMCIIDEPVEHGYGDGGIADPFMPAPHWELLVL